MKPRLCMQVCVFADHRVGCVPGNMDRRHPGASSMKLTPRRSVNRREPTSSWCSQERRIEPRMRRFWHGKALQRAWFLAPRPPMRGGGPAVTGLSYRGPQYR